MEKNVPLSLRRRNALKKNVQVCSIPIIEKKIVCNIYSFFGYIPKYSPNANFKPYSVPDTLECNPEWEVQVDEICYADRITLDGYRGDYVTLAVCKALCLDSEGCIAINYHNEVNN